MSAFPACVGADNATAVAADSAVRAALDEMPGGMERTLLLPSPAAPVLDVAAAPSALGAPGTELSRPDTAAAATTAALAAAASADRLAASARAALAAASSALALYRATASSALASAAATSPSTSRSRAARAARRALSVARSASGDTDAGDEPPSEVGRLPPAEPVSSLADTGESHATSAPSCQRRPCWCCCW